MSHGPGRIERIVEQTLQNADRSFTVEELAMVAFSGANRVDKKHRVSILRALDNVAGRLMLWQRTTYKPPWRLVISNLSNVRSYAHGVLRVVWWSAERSLDQIEQILADDEVQSELLAIGTEWWTKAEIAKAEIENASYWKAAKAAGLVDQHGGLRIEEFEAAPEMRANLKQLTTLRYYLCHLQERYDGWCLQPHVLGKFEPPGSPVYEYIMKIRAKAAMRDRNTTQA
jgi:hypothetical protein